MEELLERFTGFEGFYDLHDLSYYDSNESKFNSPRAHAG